MAQSLNPANPENSGTLPAGKLYSQEEVDALIAAAKPKMILLTDTKITNGNSFTFDDTGFVMLFVEIMIAGTYGWTTEGPFMLPEEDGSWYVMVSSDSTYCYYTVKKADGKITVKLSGAGTSNIYIKRIHGIKF
jgi:hypothetical protein